MSARGALSPPTNTSLMEERSPPVKVFSPINFKYMVGTPVRMFARSFWICRAQRFASNLIHMMFVLRMIMHICILMHSPNP